MNTESIKKTARRLEAAARQIAENADDVTVLEQIRGDVSFRALGAELELLLWQGEGRQRRARATLTEADLMAGYGLSEQEGAKK